MEEPRRRAKFLCAIAVVLGLHLAVICLLLATSRVPSFRTTSQSVEFVLIARPVVAPEHSRVLENGTRRRQITVKPPPIPGVRPQESENNAIPPPTDWAAEMSRVVNDAVSEKLAQKPRDFGFPHSPSVPDSKTPQFGWDYAATHRIEGIPEGGLLLHLNDNCVLILFPLPFAGCGIGTRKANGDLFEHMHDPARSDVIRKTK